MNSARFEINGREVVMEQLSPRSKYYRVEAPFCAVRHAKLNQDAAREEFKDLCNRAIREAMVPAITLRNLVESTESKPRKKP